ncbi:MAG: type II toxin-antitoxin system RelE/ParE family toxin [Defluviitaleaceae bacterium]|nr:type II toxin-antitoxin system RelE/ParE family toxin [Defluviitaleaceae bacterium]
MYIEFDRQAVKQLESLSKQTKQRVKSAIDGLPNGDVAKLKGHDLLRRLRVGRYRVIFAYTEKGVFVEAILPRGSAYKHY